MVMQPTRGQNILDLVFITDPDLLSDLETCAALGNSDHYSIEFKLKLKIVRPKRNARIVYNYRSANWVSLRDDFRKLDWSCIYLMRYGMLGKRYFFKV